MNCGTIVLTNTKCVLGGRNQNQDLHKKQKCQCSKEMKNFCVGIEQATDEIPCDEDLTNWT